ncbi:hypothetical protein F5B22DRAFT_631659 [Xylaria bambusicola]|uniref:uncharacterized protein n=1 Tax=Xylaria bambusicola TaxID=326684 RepID=UPI002007B983|nr:uncharacterized protein F5B22DRAFT_631659 [Xylaria bambusicola]KAI0502852.1 hypothetical protein F5B22DRAFT_631659 [Xylaria bambusicola]
MSPPTLTFVTTVGTTGLSEAAAKEMRSHVTRSNFAKRRERLAQDKRKQRKGLSRQSSSGKLDRSTESALESLQTPSQRVHGDSYTRIISSKWSLLFLDGTEYPMSTSEEAWISLLVSEPVLVESSMAFGLRHWSRSTDYQQLACDFSSKATENIINRIGTGRGFTDAVLAAVLTMAFGERIVHNDVAWNIHIDGAVQLVTERVSRGLPALSPLLEELLIKDIINDVFEFPRFYHKKFVDVACASQDTQYSSLIRISRLCETLTHWMEAIAVSRSTPQGSDFIMRCIAHPMHRILSEARAMRTGGSLVLQASCICIELIVYLSWDCLSTAINLTAVASELKDVICASQFRPCCYSDLTCCQLMLGAVAANEDSHTKEWFMNRLGGAWRVVKSRGCNNAMDILEKNIVCKASLEARFKSLWADLDRQ